MLIEDAAGPITWIDAGHNHLVVASEDGSVRLYYHRAELGQEDSQIAAPTRLSSVLNRSSLPIRCAALEKAVPSGKSPRVAVCSDELIVKVIDAGDIRRINLLTGHARAVRAASWSPKLPILITSSCDGTARIWDCSTPEPNCTKVLDGLPVTKPEDEADMHAEWHPSGHFFVLPSKGNELIVYSSKEEGWIRSGVFASQTSSTSVIQQPSGPITALSFCPNGRYLAAATADNQITIWEMSSRAPVRARRAEAHVTGLSWHPSANTLAWTDTDGQLIRWQDVLSSNHASPFESIAFGAPQSNSTRTGVDDLFAGIDDEDSEQMNDEAFGNDQAGDGKERRPRIDFEDDADNLDHFVVVDDDDDDGGYSKALASERRRGLKAKFSQPRHAAIEAQPTFQPNSTPMRNSRRFLSLSLLGSLLSIDQDTHHVVSFESFDTAARRNWKLVDYFGYSMASVAAGGALLACPRKGDNQSAVHFKPFEAAGAWSMPGAEWRAEMPRGEEVVAIAMGGAPQRRPGRESGDEVADVAAALTSTAVVATSSGYLRFFSSSGLQRYVWAFGSPVVALAAGKQHALVVHRNQTPLEGFQHLSYTLIDLISFQTKQTGVLPLGKEVTLQWTGFNELDIPVVYDSRGVLCLLDRAFAAPGQSRWTPVLDTALLSASRDGGDTENDSSRTRFWPLAASATQMFCIFVRGQNSFPDPSANGHPLIQEVDLKLPLVGLNLPGGELEERRLRQTLLASAVRSAFGSLVVAPTEYASEIPVPAALVHESDKDILQIIQLACKSDKHARALDAARELHGNRMLDAALQIAGFFRLTSLADRMASLKEWVETRTERDERLEREGVESIATEDFAEAASRSRRIFAASSPSPALAPSASAQARKALTEDFRMSSSVTPRRSQQLRSLSAAENFEAASSSLAFSALMPPPLLSRSRDREEEVSGGSEGENEQSGARKRKAVGSREVVEAEKRAFQRQRSSASANAFNKTNFGGGGGSSSSSTGAPSAMFNRNPFARQPGVMRDRSMHKSNSFFDRAEADLTAPLAASSSSSKSNEMRKKPKQATLFGKVSSSGSKSGTSASVEAAARQIPEETQPSAVSESQEMTEEDYNDEESLRFTLSNAIQRSTSREERDGLEETQLVDEETETKSTDVASRSGGGGRENSDSGSDGRNKLEAFRRQNPVSVA